MGFDEFEQRLLEIKKEFKSINHRDLSTIEELDKYLFQRKFKNPRKRALRSLKGLNF